MVASTKIVSDSYDPECKMTFAAKCQFVDVAREQLQCWLDQCFLGCS